MYKTARGDSLAAKLNGATLNNNPFNPQTQDQAIKGVKQLRAVLAVLASKDAIETFSDCRTDIKSDFVGLMSDLNDNVGEILSKAFNVRY